MRADRRRDTVADSHQDHAAAFVPRPDFIYALTFISSSENKTIPVGAITELVNGDVYHWGALMAAALTGSVPVVILYSFFVEHYVSAMTGAVKE
jgi:multiple sugar transport system permease protein